MKKILGKLLSGALVAVAACSLAACDNGGAPSKSDAPTGEVQGDKLVELTPVASTIPAAIISNEVEAGLTQIQFKARKADGTFDKVNVTMDMIDADELAKFNITESSKNIQVTIKYEGLSFTISVKVQKAIEVDTSGVKITVDPSKFTVNVLKNGLEAVPTDCDFYVYTWQAGEKWSPVIDGIAYIPENVNIGLCAFVEKGKQPAWDTPQMLGQTIDLSIENGAFVIPEITEPGADMDYTIDLEVIKNNIETGTIPADGVLMGYVTGPISGEYFVEIDAEGKFVAGNDARTIVGCYMPAGTTVDTADLANAVAKTKTLYCATDGQGAFGGIYACTEIKIDYDMVAANINDAEKNPIPEAYDLYIFVFGEVADNRFFPATLSEDGKTITGLVPAGSQNAIVAFCEYGATASWNSRLAQSVNLKTETTAEGVFQAVLPEPEQKPAE